MKAEIEELLDGVGFATERDRVEMGRRIEKHVAKLTGAVELLTELLDDRERELGLDPTV